MRWSEIIEEGVRDAHLYHGAPLATAVQILASDTLRPHTMHNYRRLGFDFAPGRPNLISGVSLTRNPRFARTWAKGGVVFVIDQQKLRQRFFIRPFDFYQPLSREGSRPVSVRTEAEEFCITDRGITPLSRFLASIEMTSEAFEAAHAIAMTEEGARPFTDLIEHPLLKIV
jgi:hypothetical protein